MSGGNGAGRRTVVRDERGQRWPHGAGVVRRAGNHNGPVPGGKVGWVAGRLGSANVKRGGEPNGHRPAQDPVLHGAANGTKPSPHRISTGASTMHYAIVMLPITLSHASRNGLDCESDTVAADCARRIAEVRGTYGAQVERVLALHLDAALDGSVVYLASREGRAFPDQQGRCVSLPSIDAAGIAALRQSAPIITRRH
jgi:hypothetical protein